jgi:hypothetical protein
MSLEEFAQGGFEVADAKVLVIVKSISTRKKGQQIFHSRSNANLTSNSHEKGWDHSRTRQGWRDGRYKRSNIIVMGHHFNKPDRMAAISDCAAHHES